ncbi:MAG: hypothetical protein NTZ97_02865 [Candidatus Moranbacteria bacterium]|nr:hypothetical protein [Candidatus Moranbacteria bacterium]
MFNFGNKTSGVSSSANQKPTANIQSEIENIPIHTMQRDLDEISGKVKPQEEAKPAPVQVKPSAAVFNGGGNENIKNNPFFKFTPQQKIFSEPQTASPQPNISKTGPQVINPFQPGSPSGQIFKGLPEEKIEKISLGKSFIIAGIALIIVMIAGGGYYFWMTKSQETVTPPPVAPPVVKPLPKFETDKPNYLVLDVEISTAKETLRKKISEVIESKIATPIEFSVVDSSNNPIEFQAFANIFGIALPENILSNLSASFSFFIFNDGTSPAVGIAVDAKDEVKLKIDLAAEEINLPKDFSPIFPTSEYSLAEKPIVFADNSYRGMPTRFFNIINKYQLSIDYGISQKKLYLGTTLQTLLSIYDYVASHTAATPAVTNESSNMGVGTTGNAATGTGVQPESAISIQ